MDETDYELLELAYEVLYDIDSYEIKATAEKYIRADKLKSLDLEDIKIMAAYVILNIV